MNTEISEVAQMLTQAEDVVVNAKNAGKKAAAKKNVKLATVEQVVSQILPEELEDSCMTEPSDLELEVELEDEEPDGELSEEESFDGAVNRALQATKPVTMPSLNDALRQMKAEKSAKVKKPVKEPKKPVAAKAAKPVILYPVQSFEESVRLHPAGKRTILNLVKPQKSFSARDILLLIRSIVPGYQNTSVNDIVKAVQSYCSIYPNHPVSTWLHATPTREASLREYVRWCLVPVLTLIDEYEKAEAAKLAQAQADAKAEAAKK